MSQNNYILIQQKLSNLFEVSDRDADTDYTGKVYKTRTLRKAVEKANELEEECLLGFSKYGIRIMLLPKVKKTKNI